MTNQLDFALHPDPPRARKSDGDGSHVAAEQIKPHLSNQRREVYEALVKHPARTSLQLAEAAGLDRYKVARRLPELEQMGYAERVQRDGQQAIWFALQPKGAA